MKALTIPMIERARSDSWIFGRRPNPEAGLRLFCFPYAGSSAAVFRTWADDLPASVDVCPVQYPGHGTRLMEPSYTRLSPLVEALVPALEPLMDRPFAFFGHSLGAIVSFELARELRRRLGLLPVCLFVSAGRAPQAPSRHQPIHSLADADFLEEMRRLNGTPSEILASAELMRILLPILRADFTVGETYVYSPEPPLACRIVSMGGEQDPRVSRGDLEAWRAQTSAGFTLRTFPGDHFFLNTDRRRLLQFLSDELNRGL